MPSRLARGICRLTWREGAFVEAHLIPQALTRTARRSGLVQVGIGHRPSRKWSSWYDTALVTKAGEDILSELDSAGVAELRRHRLVWSSWQGKQELDGVQLTMPDRGVGARSIQNVVGRSLRLFFLSLLWRAAATTRAEFSEIELTPFDLEALRQLVLNRDPGPPSFYPCMLTQLSTLGVRHNNSPIAELIEEPRVPGRRLLRTRRFVSTLMALLLTCTGVSTPMIGRRQWVLFWSGSQTPSLFRP